VNSEALELLADQAKNTMFGLYDMFSGKNLSQMTIFALGIMPYISASIILQLLTVVWPYLERLSKEGSSGAGRSRSTRATARSSWPSSRRSASRCYLEHQTNVAAACRWSTDPAGASADDRADLTTGTASSCGSASRSPSAASATACRSSSTRDRRELPRAVLRRSSRCGSASSASSRC
jgi:hypothetical protein